MLNGVSNESPDVRIQQNMSIYAYRSNNIKLKCYHRLGLHLIFNLQLGVLFLLLYIENAQSRLPIFIGMYNYSSKVYVKRQLLPREKDAFVTAWNRLNLLSYQSKEASIATRRIFNFPCIEPTSFGSYSGIDGMERSCSHLPVTKT